MQIRTLHVVSLIEAYEMLATRPPAKCAIRDTLVSQQEAGTHPLTPACCL